MHRVGNPVAQTGAGVADRVTRADQSAPQASRVDQRGSSAFATVNDHSRKKLEAKLTVLDKLDKFGQSAIRHIKASQLVWHITDWAGKAKAELQTTNMMAMQKRAIIRELADSTKDTIGTFKAVWDQRFDKPKLYAKFLDFAAIDQPEIAHFLREMDTFRVFPTIGAAEKILNDCFLVPKLDSEGQPVEKKGKWLLNFSDQVTGISKANAIRAAIDTAKAEPSRANFNALEKALSSSEVYLVGTISKNCNLGPAVRKEQQASQKT